MDSIKETPVATNEEKDIEKTTEEKALDKMTKAELIELIKNQPAAAPAPEPAPAPEGEWKPDHAAIRAALRKRRPKTKRIQLFQDDGRYKNDVLASVNGRSFLVQRGVEVEVPYSAAVVIERSIKQDARAAAIKNKYANSARFPQ